jgi:hypothetical protein
MGRTIKKVTITAEGRDKGKTFVITEVPGAQAEMWGMRMLNGAMQTGISLGDIDPMTGLAGVAGLGMLAVTAIARMPWAIAQPLLEEMFECVQIQSPDGTLVRPLNASDTEEIATRLQLREEVASLHLGFSLAERFATWMQVMLTRISSTTPTSLDPSASSSQGAKPPGANSPPS